MLENCDFFLLDFKEKSIDSSKFLKKQIASKYSYFWIISLSTYLSQAGMVYCKIDYREIYKKIYQPKLHNEAKSKSLSFFLICFV